MKSWEERLEAVLFSSRWLLAPFYIDLILAVAVLLVNFVQEFFHLLPGVLQDSDKEIILSILTLVDISLIASLLLIVIFSGYESFVSKFTLDEGQERPEWMGKVTFSGLKIKLFGSIVAISGIELLKAYTNMAAYTQAE
ncbi:MAG: YqhA family protein [Algiphilus sp.]